MARDGEVYVRIGLNRAGEVVEVQRRDGEMIRQSTKPCKESKIVETIHIKVCLDPPKPKPGEQPPKPGEPPTPPAKNPCIAETSSGGFYCYCPPDECP